MKKNTPLFIASTISLIVSTNLFADAIISFKQSGSLAETQTNQIYIKDKRINLTESQNPNDEYSIFDANKNELIHISPEHKAYMVVDQKKLKQQMGQMKQKMDMMMAQMRERMKNLPPEQRQMMEQMMAKQGMDPQMMVKPPKMPERKMVKTGTTEKISGISCKVIKVMIENRLAEEHCIARESQLPISEQDRQTIAAMRQFMSSMADQAKNIMGDMGGDSSLKFDGVPVRTRHYSPDGTMVYENLLQSISTDSVDQSKINIPAGYREQKMGR